MNKYFSDHDAGKLKIEIKLIWGIDGDIDVRLLQYTQAAFTYSKLTIGVLEQGVKYIQS